MHARLASLVALAGCAGGSFHLEPRLAAGAKHTISGPRYQGGHCDAIATGIEQLADGTTIQDGDVTLVASAARVTDDIRDQIDAHVFEDLARIQKLVTGQAHGDTFSQADLDDPGHSPNALVAAIIAILKTFKSVSENASFSVVVRVQDREVAATCRSVNRATTMGVFNPPDFTVTCGLVAPDLGVRQLHLHGVGSWANYGFEGTLDGGARPWTIRSQNVSVMGAGGIRGFEIRDGQQIGAVSFQEQGPLDASGHSTVVSAEWHVATGSRVDDDMLRATLALLYAFPWPNECDRHALAARPFR